MSIPMEQFGKDHWSVFAFIETAAVDHQGIPDLRRMRCNAQRHPEYLWAMYSDMAQDASRYPTFLADGKEQPDHDDWDCADDLVAAGLLDDIGFTMTPRYALTEAGVAMASELRVHKAAGGNFSNFRPQVLAAG